MFSIYKASTIAVIAAVSASMILSVSSIAAPLASEASAAPAAVGSTIAAEGDVTRSDARKMVNDYLKESGKKNLRAGRTRADGQFWVVKLTSPLGVDAGAMRVNRVSGELSKS